MANPSFSLNPSPNPDRRPKPNPTSHKAAAPKGDWLSSVYFQDSTHPSRFGQKLVAGVMAQRLTRQLVHRHTAPLTSITSGGAPDGAPVQRGERGQSKFLTQQAALSLSPNLSLSLCLSLSLSLSLSLTKFLTQQAADFFSVASHSLLDFTDPVLAARAPRAFVVHKAGFARLEDVPGKPGLILTLALALALALILS